MSQDEIVDFLSTGASYGLPGHLVTRIETHCSIVFLIGDNAFKLKRPIAFSTLDYTSVERREAACRRELELNRRTAPELYLAVRAIRRDRDGGMTFEGAGPVVDWVVAMRRFEQSDLFDHLADNDRLTPRLLRELGDEIARFHAVAQVTEGFGGAPGLAQAVEHNRRDQLTVESVLESANIERLYTSSMEALDRVRALLERRRAGGRVRLCHGDLRLANICLYQARPTLFDAIEFADELSCIDVLYDLAFLLMDLDQRGLHGQANLVFNRYLDATRDIDGLRALPLMMSIRAGTRAYAVAASSLRKTDRDQCLQLAAAARTLMRLALSLLRPCAPCLIAVGGGTEGDIASISDDLAPRFAPAPGACVVRNGHQATATLIGQATAIVTAGYTAILAAPFDDDRSRQQVADLAQVKHVPFVGLWLADVQKMPVNWHVVDRASATGGVIASARRLAGVSASQREPGDR